jgi:hypothetical protein
VQNNVAVRNIDRDDLFIERSGNVDCSDSASMNANVRSCTDCDAGALPSPRDHCLSGPGRGVGLDSMGSCHSTPTGNVRFPNAFLYAPSAVITTCGKLIRRPQLQRINDLR